MNVVVFSAVLIAVGAAVMALAIARTRVVLRRLEGRQTLRAWRSLFALMIAFFIGYFAVLGLLIVGIGSGLMVLTGAIFLGGAAFVLGVVTVTDATIQDLQTAMDIAASARDERDEALALSHQKSAFLANMSHELRTPLNAIIGYSEMLLEEAGETGQHHILSDLARVRSAGRHLLGLINDILDLSKIESGKMEIRPTDVEVVDLLNEIADLARPLAATRHNELVFEHVDDLGLLRTDRHRLRQCLVNLLSNACKFTEKGVVTFRTTATDDRISFEVHDTGVGMTPQQQLRVFDAFSQGDGSTTRRFGGSGLGLTLTKRITEMMGGTLRVESTAGVGSLFVITLSRTVPEPIDAHVTVTGRIGAPTILVVDDDDMAVDLVRRALAREDFRIVSTRSGRRGLAEVEEHPPQLIVLDIVMPDLDGWGVLDLLKAQPRLADIPVVIASHLDERARALSLGATEYLVKPIDRSKLVALARRFAGPPGTGAALVVDDDVAIRTLVARTLRHHGLRVQEASDGEQALAMVRAERPAVMLLDLMMPRVDGFEVIRQLRAAPETRTVPVVVLTAKDLDSAERAFIEESGSRVLLKGQYTRAELMEAVRRHVLTDTALTGAAS